MGRGAQYAGTKKRPGGLARTELLADRHQDLRLNSNEIHNAIYVALSLWADGGGRIIHPYKMLGSACSLGSNGGRRGAGGTDWHLPLPPQFS